VRDDGKLLATVLTRSWALPNGMQIKLRHKEGCRNAGNDALIMNVIEKANPVTITEFEIGLRATMLTIGCEDCGVDKTTLVGVLFRHSQNPEYLPETGNSRSTDESPSSSGVSSWGNSTILDQLPSSERKLYKNFKDDRTLDESYSPPSQRATNKEVAMTLDSCKNIDTNGIGDSRYAEEEVVVPATANVMRRMFPGRVNKVESIDSSGIDETVAPILSTVLYSSEVDRMLLDAVEEIERNEAVPAVEETLNEEGRIVRLEKGVEEDRDLFDRLRDIVEDLEVKVHELTAWKKEVEEDGCAKCVSRERKGKYGPEGEKPALPALQIVLEKENTIPTRPGLTT